MFKKTLLISIALVATLANAQEKQKEIELMEFLFKDVKQMEQKTDTIETNYKSFKGMFNLEKNQNKEIHDKFHARLTAIENSINSLRLDINSLKSLKNILQKNSDAIKILQHDIALLDGNRTIYEINPTNQSKNIQKKINRVNPDFLVDSPKDKINSNIIDFINED